MSGLHPLYSDNWLGVCSDDRLPLSVFQVRPAVRTVTEASWCQLHSGNVPPPMSAGRNWTGGNGGARVMYERMRMLLSLVHRCIWVSGAVTAM